VDIQKKLKTMTSEAASSGDAVSARKDWEAQQRRVFSKWSSLTLGKEVDISKDFKDGRLLAQLVEKLSNKEIGMKWATGARANNRLNVLQSINTILNFLKNEKVMLTISAENIFDGDETLTMGLIWTLILKYQITNKKELLEWCRSVCSEFDIPVRNLTTSWQDGKGLCALLHCLDDSLVDMNKLSTPEENLTLCFEGASTLGIPQLLETSDLTGRPDERIVLTYISYFYQAAKHGVKKKPKEPSPPPPPPDNSEEVARLKAQVKKLKAQLREEKEKFKKLMIKSSTELQYLIKSQKDMAERLRLTNAKHKSVEKKLTELKLKMELEASSKGFSNVPPPATDNVTLLILSIAGAAKLWESSPDIMHQAVHMYNQTVRKLCIDMKGYEVKYQGEVFTLAFEDPLMACRFSIAIQQQMAHLNWPNGLDQFKETATELGRSSTQKLFSGLRPRIVINSGPRNSQEDPTTGRVDYFGPTLQRALALNRLCYGGQTLLSSSTYGAVSGHSKKLGNPAVQELGELELPETNTTDQVVQMLPAMFADRKFPVHPSPENLEAATAALHEQVSALEEQNSALQKQLEELKKEAAEASAKAAQLGSWFSKHRGRTADPSKLGALSKDFESVLATQKELEERLAQETEKNKDMKEYMARMNSQLEVSVRASRKLTAQHKELTKQHEECAQVIEKLEGIIERLQSQKEKKPVKHVPVDDSRYITKRSEPQRLVKLPQAVKDILQAYPHLKVLEDTMSEGNWIIGETSYSLRDIRKLRIDGIDLLPTFEEREAAREKRREKGMKKRSSTFSRLSSFVGGKHHDTQGSLTQQSKDAGDLAVPSRSQTAPIAASSKDVASSSKDVASSSKDDSKHRSRSSRRKKKKSKGKSSKK